MNIIRRFIFSSGSGLFILMYSFLPFQVLGDTVETQMFLPGAYQKWNANKKGSFMYVGKPYYLLIDDKLLAGFRHIDEISFHAAFNEWLPLSEKEYSPAIHNVAALSLLLNENPRSNINRLIKLLPSIEHRDESSQLLISLSQRIMSNLGVYRYEVNGKLDKETISAIKKINNNAVILSQSDTTDAWVGFWEETFRILFNKLDRSNYYTNVHDECERLVRKEKENKRFHCLVSALTAKGKNWLYLAYDGGEWFETKNDLIVIMIIAHALDAGEFRAAPAGARLILTSDQLPYEPELISKLLLRGSELNDSESMFMLGQAYDEGGIFEVDYKKANSWYEKATKNSYVDAMNALAYNLYTGIGATDRTRAKFLYSEAGRRESAIARMSLLRIKKKKNPLNYKRHLIKNEQSWFKKILVSVLLSDSQIFSGFYIAEDGLIITSGQVATLLKTMDNKELQVINSAWPDSIFSARFLTTVNNSLLSLLQVENFMPETSANFETMRTVNVGDAVAIKNVGKGGEEFFISRIKGFNRRYRYNFMTVSFSDCDAIAGSPLFLERTGSVIGVGINAYSPEKITLNTKNSNADCFFLSTDEL